MRIMILLAALGLVACGAVFADYYTGFEAGEGYSGSAGGDLMNGTNGWYTPGVGGNPFYVYTYAGNSLGVALNPKGGDQFAAATSTGATPFVARANRDHDWSTRDLWRVSYDILGLHLPGAAASQNLGSWSLQDSALQRFFIALNPWADVANPVAWNAQYNVYNSAGGALNNQSPGAAWNLIPVNHWMRQSITFNLATNQILQVDIEDLTTGQKSIYLPTNWWLTGGQNYTLPRPTALRMFVGGSTAGNVMAWDNLTVGQIPEPVTMSLVGFGALAALKLRRRR